MKFGMKKVWSSIFRRRLRLRMLRHFFEIFRDHLRGFKDLERSDLSRSVDGETWKEWVRRFILGFHERFVGGKVDTPDSSSRFEKGEDFFRLNPCGRSQPKILRVT